MSNSITVSMPTNTHSPLFVKDGATFVDPTLYRSIVSSLQYLTFTYPDISYVVNSVCQYKHAPTNVHWQAVKRILYSIKGTYNYGLHLRPTSLDSLLTYSDTD